ncbi:carbohydrate binding domain-containing protein [Nonomuraea salmonea]|uniref:carbohydrate binding domain-containing protein n=1 Tax=Nonomuraea salmonea TaxID=46181 RepID=UPI002FEC714A
MGGPRPRRLAHRRPPPPAQAAEPLTVTDFESDGVPAGVYAWGNDTASTPALTVEPGADRPDAPATNRVLTSAFTISQWGGWSHDLPATADWSAYEGFSFHVKGTGSGQRVFFELKDGGGGPGTAELFESSFTDDVAGWREVRVPFADFTRRTDYQPGGAPTDGELDLVEIWGYAMRLPVGTGTFTWDEVRLYGTAPPRPVRLSADRPVLPVDEKGSAELRVTVTTADGAPLPADLAVDYRTGTGTATPGADYTPRPGHAEVPGRHRVGLGQDDHRQDAARPPERGGRDHPDRAVRRGRPPARRAARRRHQRPRPALPRRPQADQTARRRSARQDDAGGEGRADDPGRTRGPRQAERHRGVPARLPAVRRRLDAPRRTPRRRGPT